MPQEWLTTGKAAELLGVSRSTIVRHIEAGTLEARRPLAHSPGHSRKAAAGRVHDR
jgi:excisionase family DNA binding protein